MRVRSGPILPPTPLMAWHLTQPFWSNTREPAAGSWLGPAAGCAAAGRAAHSARRAARTTPIADTRIERSFLPEIRPPSEAYPPAVACYREYRAEDTNSRSPAAAARRP